MNDDVELFSSFTAINFGTTNTVELKTVTQKTPIDVITLKLVSVVVTKAKIAPNMITVKAMLYIANINAFASANLGSMFLVKYAKMHPIAIRTKKNATSK